MNPIAPNSSKCLSPLPPSEQNPLFITDLARLIFSYFQDDWKTLGKIWSAELSSRVSLVSLAEQLLRKITFSPKEQESFYLKNHACSYSIFAYFVSNSTYHKTPKFSSPFNASYAQKISTPRCLSSEPPHAPISDDDGTIYVTRSHNDYSTYFHIISHQLSKSQKLKIQKRPKYKNSGKLKFETLNNNHTFVHKYTMLHLEAYVSPLSTIPKINDRLTFYFGTSNHRGISNLDFLEIEEKTLNVVPCYRRKPDYFAAYRNHKEFGPAISPAMVGKRGDFFYLQKRGALSLIDASNRSAWAEKNWTWKVKVRTLFPSSPIVDRATNVYFLGLYLNDSILFCINGNTGDLVWECPLSLTNFDEKPSGLLPNIMLNHLSQNLFSISEDFHIYCLNTKSVLKERELFPHTKFWDYYLKPPENLGHCHSAIMRRDGKIYAFSHNCIYCIYPDAHRPESKRTGALGKWEPCWTLKIDKNIISEPILDEKSRLYFITEDYRLMGVTARGKLIGTYDLATIHPKIRQEMTPKEETDREETPLFSRLTIDTHGNIHFLSHIGFLYQVDPNELR